jgi:hypothetical protein
MEANLRPDGTVLVSMSLNEAVIVRELISNSEFAVDLEVIELFRAVEKKVMSDLQHALSPCIPNLGTDDYSRTADAASRAVDPGTYKDR